MRTIVDLPEENIRSLDLLGKKRDLSRAELVRRAVAAYIEKEMQEGTVSHDIYGQFGDVFTRDAVAIQQDLRGEWDTREPMRNWGLHESPQSPYQHAPPKK